MTFRSMEIIDSGSQINGNSGWQTAGRLTELFND